MKRWTIVVDLDAPVEYTSDDVMDYFEGVIEDSVTAFVRNETKLGCIGFQVVDPEGR